MPLDLLLDLSLHQSQIPVSFWPMVRFIFSLASILSLTCCNLCSLLQTKGSLGQRRESTDVRKILPSEQSSGFQRHSFSFPAPPLPAKKSCKKNNLIKLIHARVWPTNHLAACLLHPVYSFDSMDCSPPGSSVDGILQTKILEWVALASSRESSPTRDRTRVSGIGSQLGSHQTSHRDVKVNKWNQLELQEGCNLTSDGPAFPY